MSTVRHAHSSSLYSETPQSLAKQLDRAIAADDPDATLLTFTEVGSDNRAQVLKDANEGWAAWIPGATDVGLMWRKSAYSPVWKESHKLTDKVWTDGQGRKHETHCGTALLRHTDGKTVFLSVCHLPSNVQNGDHFNDNKQAAAWKSAVHGWADYWNNKRKKDHPDLAMIVADWNVDFHMSAWRDYVQGVFPSLHLCWKGNMPNGGTHGPRLIDASWNGAKATKAKLLQDDGSSDHRPYGEKVPWPS